MAQVDPALPSNGPTNEPPILILSRNLAVRQFRASDAEQVAKHSNDKVMWLHGPDTVPHPFTLPDAQAYISKSLDTSHNSMAFWSLVSLSTGKSLIRSINFEEARRTVEKLGWLPLADLGTKENEIGIHL
jgi:hypothetical protein